MAVLGEFKAGKSSLVNALLGADICPVDADVATAVPTVLRGAAAPEAHGVRRAASNEDGRPPAPEPIAPGDVAAACTDAAEWRLVEVGLPHPLLEAGLVLVDTPGVGGLDARHVADALGVLAGVDAVLFAADAASELGAPALEVLGQVASLGPATILVLTKWDLYLHTDVIAAANRAHLDRAGLDAPILVTSAELRRLALRTGDPAVDAESGFDRLEALLASLVARSGVLVAQRAASTALDVAGQLRTVFEAEAAALAAGAAATGEAAAPTPPRPVTATWQQLLSDDTTDLTADLDHEVRRRSRELAAAAEEALADGDPSELWPEVSAWLAERAAADVVAVFALLRDRTFAMAGRVAERFEDTLGQGWPIDPGVLDELTEKVLAALPGRAELPDGTTGRFSAGLNALRSSFYSFTMFSTIGALVGVAAAPIAPAALALGLALGGKSLRDEKKRTVTQRRAQARAAVRSYLDEVTFVTSKEARDGLRNVQRALRDHFTVLAAEQQRSAAEAAAAAQAATRADARSRAARAEDVAAELARIDTLAERAAMLADAARDELARIATGPVGAAR